MSEKISTQENLDTITLRQAVKDTLRNYFSNIGNEHPVDFYSILLEEIERPLLETLILVLVVGQVFYFYMHLFLHTLFSPYFINCSNNCSVIKRFRFNIYRMLCASL